MPAPTTTTVLSELHHAVQGAGTPLLFILGARGDAAHVARAAGVPTRLRVSRDGFAGDAGPTAWPARRLELPVRVGSGHHAPHLRHPEVFAERQRPVLRELA